MALTLTLDQLQIAANKIQTIPDLHLIGLSPRLMYIFLRGFYDSIPVNYPSNEENIQIYKSYLYNCIYMNFRIGLVNKAASVILYAVLSHPYFRRV